MKKKSYYLVSLGCAKNTVDSVSMATLLEEAGYTQVENHHQAEVMIVNTCGFIHSARQESLQELRNLADHKKHGQLLIAAGCLTQRYREQVIEQVPGIDGLIGTRRWMDIVEVVSELRQQRSGVRYHIPEDASIGRDEHDVLRGAIQGASAYLKIADGCRRPCAFCAIPLIKGTLVSRPLEAILADALALDEMGVQELILIAQDTTDYGHDLGTRDGLPDLLDRLLKETSLPWIRIMYAFPGYVTDRLIETMATNPRILPYLDMPLQHAHPDTLKRMRRPANMEWVYKTIEKMRKAIPSLALRSTFIVGYPGETEEEFQTLLDFLQEIKLDRAGAFTFSFEKGTASEPLGDPIPQEVKEERYRQFMLTQEKISLAKNQAFIGQKLNVLVENHDRGIYYGRSYRDAPEIDGLVLFDSPAPPGQIVPVLINGAMPHDLSGTLINT